VLTPAAVVDITDPVSVPRQRDGSPMSKSVSRGVAEEPRNWRGRRPDPEHIIGRTVDLAYVVDAVRRSRLVVLTGPGGVGKTRLALAAADRIQPLFRDGVAVVELGHVPAERDTCDEAFAHVHRAVMTAITSDPPRRGLPQSGNRSGAPRNPDLLLVLDNAEHVVTAVGRLARQLLAEQPGVRTMVTTRRPPGVTPAYVWEVGPLDVDAAGGVPPAMELFLRRAAASCPTLDLAGSQPAVMELCRRLEGMPLAIELAARQVRSVPLDTLLRGEPIARILGQAGAGGLAHQRTLSDSVRWSYDLLGEVPRWLLHHLARLFDRFTIEDLERVPLWDDASGADPLVGSLADLVEASLIQVRRGTQYQYRFFSYVREFVNGLHYQAQLT
jgi:predicted ATPase